MAQRQEVIPRVKGRRLSPYSNQPGAMMETTLFDKVNQVLDTLRPMLLADGGNVDLVSVEEGTVRVKLKGACGSCPMSQMTLKMGIERELKRHSQTGCAV